MSLPLQELAYSQTANNIVRLTENGLEMLVGSGDVALEVI